MRLICLCVLLTACSASTASSAVGVLGLLIGGWLLLIPRARGEMGPLPEAMDAGPDAADATADADAAGPPPYVGPCLCAAEIAADGPPAPLAVPGFDPLAIHTRVRAALPPDVRARLDD